METSPTPNSQPPFPYLEMAQIEAAIRTSTELLGTLSKWRAAMTAELDRITRPASPSSTPTPKTIGPGFEYQGQMIHHWKAIDIHADLLRHLWAEFPEHRAAMAQAMANCGTSRTYVASTREALFRWQPPDFVVKHSRPLVEGWYLDTNINRKRMARILPAAVRAAGLAWGTDVRVYWRRIEVLP